MTAADCQSPRQIYASAALAFFTCLVVPLQTLLGSGDLFDFGVWRLLAEACPFALCVTLVWYAFVRFVQRTAPVLPVALTLALTVCFYLESGVLSIRLPVIDGVSGLFNLVRSAISAAVWILVLSLAVRFRTFVVAYARWILLGLAVLMVASLVDSRSSRGCKIDSPLSTGFAPCWDVMKNVRFSSQRNILMFLLDMTPAETMTEVMRESAELRAAFPGFVNYRQNLCMHESTSMGLPGLMTGVYGGEETDVFEYGMSIFGADSLLVPYVAATNAVYFFGGLHGFGYSNRLRERYSDDLVACDRSGSVFFRPSTSVPFLRLVDAVGIRLVPHLGKNGILRHGLAKAGAIMRNIPSAYDERVTYSQFAAMPLSDEKQTLGVFHTHGLHWPLRYDRQGNYVEHPLTIEKFDCAPKDKGKYRKAQIEQGHYVLSLLAQLMKSFQEKGIYDSATIIVAADHGCISMQEGENQGSESSVLWVKPAQSRSPFAESDAPTSNCRLHDLLCALRDSDLSEQTITEMLSQDKRLFRSDWHGVMLMSIGGKLHFTDWEYDRYGKLLGVEKK